MKKWTFINLRNSFLLILILKASLELIHALKISAFLPYFSLFSFDKGPNSSMENWLNDANTNVLQNHLKVTFVIQNYKHSSNSCEALGNRDSEIFLFYKRHLYCCLSKCRIIPLLWIFNIICTLFLDDYVFAAKAFDKLPDHKAVWSFFSDSFRSMD